MHRSYMQEQEQLERRHRQERVSRDQRQSQELKEEERRQLQEREELEKRHRQERDWLERSNRGQWRIHGGPEGPRTLPWLQAEPCISPIGAPLLVLSVSVSGYYFLSRCFWALGGVDTVSLLGPTELTGPSSVCGPSVGENGGAPPFGEHHPPKYRYLMKSSYVLG